MVSEPGELVGRGLTWNYEPSSLLSIWARPERIMAHVTGENGEPWNFDIFPPPGEHLTAGRTYEATEEVGERAADGRAHRRRRRGARVPGRPDRKLHDRRADVREGRDHARRVLVRLALEARGAVPPGTFSLHAGDSTPVAPWMVASATPTPTARRPDPDPDANGHAHPDANRDGHAEPDGHADVDADTQANGHANRDAHAEPDGDADTRAHAHAHRDTHAHAHRDAHAHAGAERDSGPGRGAVARGTATATCPTLACRSGSNSRTKGLSKKPL